MIEIGKLKSFFRTAKPNLNRSKYYVRNKTYRVGLVPGSTSRLF